MYGAFDRDEDQVLRSGSIVEVSRLLGLIGPFSGLIRKAILKQVKTEAEAILKGAS